MCFFRGQQAVSLSADEDALLEEGLAASEAQARADGVELEPRSTETQNNHSAAKEPSPPAQSISQMLLALDNVSEDSSQSEHSSVLSETANKSEASNVANHSAANSVPAEKAESTSSDDSFKENKPVVRRIVVNAVEMTPEPAQTKPPEKPSEDKTTPTAAETTEEKPIVIDDEDDSVLDRTNDDISPVKDAGSNPGAGFFKRKVKSPFKRSSSSTAEPADSHYRKYRLRCQCGAKNCRKYLF